MFKKKYLYYILPLFLMSSGTTMAQQYAVPSSSVVQTTSNKKEMDRFIKSLMSRMTLEEKIGQLSQYVGHDLLTGPQSEALSDSLLSKGAVGSILNIGGVQKNQKDSREEYECFSFENTYSFCIRCYSWLSNHLPNTSC